MVDDKGAGGTGGAGVGGAGGVWGLSFGVINTLENDQVTMSFCIHSIRSICSPKGGLRLLLR